MPTTIFHTATTLNGFLADDADSLDWLFAVQGNADADVDAEAAVESGFAVFLRTVGAFVMGAATYEWVLRHEGEQPGMWAQIYGALPCFVVTHRDLAVPAGGNVTFVAGDVTGYWHELERAAGDGAIWLAGGGDLVGQFDDAGRLDEIRVSIAPALLPSGKPLLPRRIGPDRLTLVSVAQDGQFAELAFRVSPRTAPE